MHLKTITEAYVKSLSLCIVYRSKNMSMGTMAERLGVSVDKIKNFENIKIVDFKLLDRYMQELGIVFRGEIQETR